MLDAAIAFDLLDELIEEGDKHRAAVTLGEYKSVLSNREYEEYKARIALMPVNVPTKGSVL